MDQQIVERKLDSLFRCLQRIRHKCPPDAETLKADIDCQDILVLNLSRAVQLCVDVASHLIEESELEPPATMGASFDDLAHLKIITPTIATSLKKAVGFRNLAVHNYDTINWDIVFAIAHQHINEFEDFATQIARRLDA